MDVCYMHFPALELMFVTAQHLVFSLQLLLLHQGFYFLFFGIVGQSWHPKLSSYQIRKRERPLNRG